MPRRVNRGIREARRGAAEGEHKRTVALGEKNKPGRTIAGDQTWRRVQRCRRIDTQLLQPRSARQCDVAVVDALAILNQPIGHQVRARIPAQQRCGSCALSTSISATLLSWQIDALSLIGRA